MSGTKWFSKGINRNFSQGVPTFGTVSPDTRYLHKTNNEQFCALTSVIGGESESNQKWAFYDEGKVRVNVSGYKCRCDDAGHIPFTLTFIDIDIPSIATMQILLVERTEGDNYLNSNKSVCRVRQNHYKLSDDGRHLEIDLPITLYRETKGDIRVLYKGPVTKTSR